MDCLVCKKTTSFEKGRTPCISYLAHWGLWAACHITSSWGIDVVGACEIASVNILVHIYIYNIYICIYIYVSPVVVVVRGHAGLQVGEYKA